MEAGSNSPQDMLKGQAWHQQRLALESLRATLPENADVLVARAKYLLGGQNQAHVEGALGQGVAYGGIGLLAQHTSYYDGFAVVYCTARLTAVVVRNARGPEGQVFFEERLIEGARHDSTYASVEGASDEQVGDEHIIPELFRRLIDKLVANHAGRAVDVGIVTSIPAGCLEAALASLSMAVVKAIYDLKNEPLPVGIIESLRLTIEATLGSDFSKAFVMVGRDAEAGSICVIDTATEELIPFDAPDDEHLSWALVEVESGSPKALDFYQACGEIGSKALEILKSSEFSDYTSFRDVQHDDLQRVLNILPSQYRTIVRHLINENKRVQVMIGAIRNEDWQKLGGLLFISHSSVSSEWKGSSRAIDRVVSRAEDMSSDGIYGACMTGRGGQILVVGLPLALSRFISGIENQLTSQFKRRPRSLIL